MADEKKSVKDTLSDINTHSKANVGKSFKGKGGEALYGSVISPTTGKPINPLTDRLGIDPKDINATVGGIEAIKMGAGSLYSGYKDATKHKNSIIGMAKANVFEFPVFISDSVPLEFATATNSLLEQVYAAYLQMALSINPVVDYKMIPKRQDKSQFARFKTDTTKYLECVDLSFQKESCHSEFMNEDGTYFEFDMISIEDSVARIINEAVDYQPLSEFDHYFQEGEATDQETVNHNTGEVETRHTYSYLTGEQLEKILAEIRDLNNRNVLAGQQAVLNNQQFHLNNQQFEKAVEDLIKMRRENATEQRAMREGLGNSTYNDILNKIQDRQLKRYQIAKIQQDIASAQKQDKINDLQAKFLAAKADAYGNFIDKYRITPDDFLNQVMVNKEERDKAKDRREEEKNRREEEKHQYEMGSRKASQFIDESKIQKMNTMKPLMMVTTMYIKSKEGNVSHPIEYVVGVKTHCRLIESSMLPEVVQYPLKEMNKVSRKAKWRAGELKLFKDILFHVKEKKQTAIDSKDPRRKWFRRLYELAHMKGDGNVSRYVSGNQYTHGLIPNATIVISKSDVDHIEDVTKIDMLKGSTARAFCEQLFLMNFIVIDTDSESIKILTPDINNDFEVQSLAAVNKQIAQLDTAGKSTLDVFKMLR